MSDTLPKKRLVQRRERIIDKTKTFNQVFAEVKERIANALAAYKTGNLEAPSMKDMIYLGSIYDTEVPIFKVNVPGWIYRFSPVGDLSTTATTEGGYGSDYGYGKTGILLADDPNNLRDNSAAQKQKRILYMTAWDGKNSNANAMFPVNPGSKTYMALTHDAKPSGGAHPDSKKELFFVPTVAAVNMLIHPDDYVIKVGSTNVNLDLVDVQATFVDNPLVKSIFDGVWCRLDSRGHLANFAAVQGWMKVRRNTITFLNTGLRDLFYETHPESQLVRDAYEDYWRYGLLAVGYAEMGKPNMKAAAIAAHSTKPWLGTQGYSPETIAITQECFTAAGINEIGTKGRYYDSTNKATLYSGASIITPDGVNFGAVDRHCIAFYGEIYLEAGVTYTLEGQYDDYVYISIDNKIVFENTYGTDKKTTYTPTTSGWHEFTLVGADLADTVSGGLITISSSDGKYNKFLLHNDATMIAPDCVNRCLFRVPPEVSYAEYTKWNHYLKKQALAK